MSPEEFAAWVEASCRRHDVPVKLNDPAVLRSVRVLLTGRAGSSGASRGTGRPASDSPDDVDPVGVEPSRSGTANRGDHDPVDEGSDDGGLSGEVEAGPLSA